jgi:hypothetical protein
MRKRFFIVVAFIAFGCVGAYHVSSSSAAVQSVAAEAETGVISPAAKTIADSTASSGSVVRFTSTVSQPPPTCTAPLFTTSATDGGWSNGGYYVHNNMWNPNYPVTETMYACAYNNWYVVANANNNSGDGAVKTYPNVHKDYSGRTVASFTTLTSTFSSISPSVGIYDIAYDLWLNGVPNDEIMIWTDNYKQVPAGSRFASNVSLSGFTWDVYATNDNGYIALVPSNGARLTKGSLDLKAILNYLVAQGKIVTSSTVDQIGFGVELVSTDSSNQTFTVNDFSINNN